jgi:hypothetical protein
MNIREKTTEELRSDIAQTRHRVAAQVDAIDNKLSARNMVAETKLAVRRNPLPFALAGAGVAVLFTWALLRLAGIGRRRSAWSF